VSREWKIVPSSPGETTTCLSTKVTQLDSRVSRDDTIRGNLSSSLSICTSTPTDWRTVDRAEECSRYFTATLLTSRLAECEPRCRGTGCTVLTARSLAAFIFLRPTSMASQPLTQWKQFLVRDLGVTRVWQRQSRCAGAALAQILASHIGITGTSFLVGSSYGTANFAPELLLPISGSSASCAPLR
jgi:hypothetical protein